MCLVLAGCAHDNYVVIPDSDGSKEDMSQDLKDCKHEAIHKYYDNQPPMTGEQMVGMVAAGALGGAIGGAAFGAAMSGDEDDKTMKIKDIDPYIEKCMLEKGYKGTSN